MLRSPEHFGIELAVKAGRLKLVLRGYAPAGSGVSFVYSERRYQSPRVRVLVDFLRQRIAADPWWDRLLEEPS
jgi:DNA-binding transcriptional LysR family regulator